MIPAAPDIALFLEHMGWLGRHPRFRNNTRIAMLTWIGRRLAPGARARLLRSYPLTHEARRRAEDSLIAVLGKALLTPSWERKDIEDVDRRVDWAETYSRHFGLQRPPQPYHARIPREVPDRMLLGALLGLADDWASVLEVAESALEREGETAELSRRALRLRCALAAHAGRRIAFLPYDSRIDSRLRRIGRDGIELADAIAAVHAFENSAFGSDKDDASALQRVCASLAESDLDNADTLLELTTALSIARAAEQAERVDWATGEPWRVDSIDSEDARYPSIVLRAGSFRCRVGKGPPRAHGCAVADRLGPWVRQLLRGGYKGNQPDIVLTFWMLGLPESVFVMGDSKRNLAGTGAKYIRASVEVAAVYLMSYGYAMGLQVPNDVSAPVTTAVMPGMTLFCRQGTRDDAATMIALLRSTAGELPVVLGFDVEQHFGPCLGSWSSEVLSAWLGALGRQAHQLLTRRHVTG